MRAVILIAIALLFSAQAQADGLIKKRYLVGGTAAVVVGGNLLATKCANATSDDWLGAPLTEDSFSKHMAFLNLCGEKEHRESFIGQPGKPPGLTDYDFFARSNNAKLIKSLVSNGEGDPIGCEAHHMVPKGDNRKWAKDTVDQARGLLAECGVDIDSHKNGIWLPKNNKDPAECTGLPHKKIHTKLYYEAILQALSDGYGEKECVGVEEALSSIKNSLRSGAMAY